MANPSRRSPVGGSWRSRRPHPAPGSLDPARIGTAPAPDRLRVPLTVSQVKREAGWPGILQDKDGVRATPRRGRQEHAADCANLAGCAAGTHDFELGVAWRRSADRSRRTAGRPGRLLVVAPHRRWRCWPWSQARTSSRLRDLMAPTGGGGSPARLPKTA